MLEQEVAGLLVVLFDTAPIEGILYMFNVCVSSRLSARYSRVYFMDSASSY